MPTPEDEARKNIDELLVAAGWSVQDYKQRNLGASLGVAVRYFQLPPDEADYLLFVDRKPVGIIEAKPLGHTLSGVSEQSEKYLRLIPKHLPNVEKLPPFHYESTGVETFFRDLRDPNSRSRRVFGFHKPETLRDWFEEQDTLRARLQKLPPLDKGSLWDCQHIAINNLEKSFAQSRPRALIQMATGSGKTFTAVSFVYRLIKFAGAKRVLFLVDRNNLGRQTKREFENYETPDDGRKFTQIYNIQHLQSNAIDEPSKVVITTIQRLYSMLRGQEVFEEEIEEDSLFEKPPTEMRPVDVEYNTKIPIEMFDFVITDECHRSIYNVWRQVLEYFDATIIGLTATPSKHTLGFFNQNLVTQYDHQRAVADGVNVQYQVFRIKTKITAGGSKVEAGEFIDKRDKMTRKERIEKMEKELEYDSAELDRSVVAPDQIRTIVQAFKDNLPAIFPNRQYAPKTLIFAKDDSHAEDIVHIAREVFGQGNEFCKKITYRTTGEKPEDILASFRNSFNPRIAVTVDMVATGTDIRPLECLVFMRDVKSQIYFEQMKGRGTRTISRTDLNAVTPDAFSKSHFVIVDAVGVCESDKTETRPLDRAKKGVTFEQLLNNVVNGAEDEDTLSSLAARIARFAKEIVKESDLKEIEKAAGDISLKVVINNLLDAVDPDKQIEKAKEEFKTDNPSQEQITKATKELTKVARSPFDRPEFRDTILRIKQRNEQIIDRLSKDEVLVADFDRQAKDRSEEIVTNFKKFIEEKKDEIVALQIIYNMPYSKQRLTFEEIKQLAEAIQTPPYQLSADLVWKAYEQLDRSKVKGAGPARILTDLVALVRFALGKDMLLMPFKELIDRRYGDWMSEQEKAGQIFTQEQREWLLMIKNHVASSLSISIDDLEYTPFNKKGGAIKLQKIFGDQANEIINQMNQVLMAL